LIRKRLTAAGFDHIRQVVSWKTAGLPDLNRLPFKVWRSPQSTDIC